MLSEKECLKELENSKLLTVLIDSGSSQVGFYINFEQTTIFNTFKQLIEEHFNQQPYKAEELHEGMFVYDIYEDFVYRINKIYKNEDIDLLIETGFGYAQTLTVHFEENRFFPLIKAMDWSDE